MGCNVVFRMNGWIYVMLMLVEGHDVFFCMLIEFGGVECLSPS